MFLDAPLTFLLLLTNGAVGAYSLFVDPSLIGKWSFKPHAVRRGEWGRWLTAGFVHVGLAHLAFNMLTLFFFYKDGAAMAAQIDRVGERILPRRWHRFSRVVPATVSATVTGMTIIAVGEGIVLLEHGYRPVKRGSRFSWKADAASRASSLVIEISSIARERGRTRLETALMILLTEALLLWMA